MILAHQDDLRQKNIDKENILVFKDNEYRIPSNILAKYALVTKL